MIRRTLFACSAAAFFAGCGPTTEDLTKASARLGAETLKVVAEAKKLGDPWAARQMLDARAGALRSEAQATCIGSSSAYNRTCADLPDDAIAAVRSALAQFESSAVAAGVPSAITWAYDQRDSEEGSARLKQHAPAILDAARRARGTREDAVVLRVGGMLTASGWSGVVQRDSVAAVTMLARAWAAGDPQAANEAARVYAGMNDTRNAYLWSLRCLQGCARDAKLDLDRLQALLQPDAVRQAQAAAADATVVELDTQP